MGDSSVGPVGSEPPKPIPPLVSEPTEPPPVKPAEEIKHRGPTARTVTEGKAVPEPSGEIKVGEVKGKLDEVIDNTIDRLDNSVKSIIDDAEASDRWLEATPERYEAALGAIDGKFLTQLADKLTEADKDLDKSELEHLSALKSVYGKAAEVKGALVTLPQEVVTPTAQVLTLSFFAATALKKTIPFLEEGGLRDMLVFDWLLDRVTIDSAKAIAAGALWGEKPLAAVEFLRHGAVGAFLVFQAARLHAMEKQLNVVKEKNKTTPDPELEKQIKVLDKFLTGQYEILKSTATGYVVTTAAYVPKGYYFVDWISSLCNYTMADPVVLGFGYANALVRLPVQAYLLTQSERKWEGVQKGISQVRDRLYADPTREEFNAFVGKTLKEPTDSEKKPKDSEVIKAFTDKGIDFEKLKTFKYTILGKIYKKVEEPQTKEDVEEILSNKTLSDDIFAQYKAKLFNEQYRAKLFDDKIKDIFTNKTFEEAKKAFESTFGLKLEEVLQFLDLAKEGVSPPKVVEEMSTEYFIELFTKNAEVRKQFLERFFPIYMNKQKVEKLLAKRKDRFKSVEHKETITASRKAALKSVLNKKVEIEKSFMKFDVTTRRVVFAVTFAVTALAFVAFAILSTVFPPLGIGIIFIYLSLAIFIMGVSVLIAGHVHLKCKKPNVAKVSNYARRAWISLVKIPLAIQSFRLERRRAERMVNSSQSMTFYSAKLAEINNILKREEVLTEPLPKVVTLPGLEDVTDKGLIRERIEKLREKANKEFEKFAKKAGTLDDRIGFLEGKVKSLEEKIKSSKDELDKAGFKDFAKVSRLVTTPEGGDLKLTSTLVDAFLDPEVHADPEMIDFFQTAGFDLVGMRKEIEKEGLLVDQRKVVKEKVKAFFGTMADDFMGKISKNEAQFELLKSVYAGFAGGEEGGE